MSGGSEWMKWVATFVGLPGERERARAAANLQAKRCESCLLSHALPLGLLTPPASVPFRPDSPDAPRSVLSHPASRSIPSARRGGIRRGFADDMSAIAKASGGEPTPRPPPLCNAADPAPTVRASVEIAGAATWPTSFGFDR